MDEKALLPEFVLKGMSSNLVGAVQNQPDSKDN